MSRRRANTAGSLTGADSHTHIICYTPLLVSHGQRCHIGRFVRHMRASTIRGVSRAPARVDLKKNQISQEFATKRRDPRQPGESGDEHRQPPGESQGFFDKAMRIIAI